MPSIFLVSDSGDSLPDDISQEIPRAVVPFIVVVAGKEYRDIDLSLSKFAMLMEGSKGHYPTTSAPPPSDFERWYEFAQNQEGILVVTLGAKNSRSYQSAFLAVESFRDRTGSDIPIEVVDSRGGIMTQGFLIMEAHQMIKSEKPLGEIAETLRDHATGANLVFTCRDTTYPHRSGRVGGFKHAVASVLKIKPIVGLVDGKLEQIGITRGQSRSYSAVAAEVLKQSGGQIKKLAIIGGLGTEEGEGLVLEQILAGLDSNPEIFWTIICAAMGVHSGPHFVGAAWV